MLKTPRSLQSGSLLIEILITILVVTIGVMGVGAMQLRTLGDNHWQLQKSTATLLSYQIFESMRANRSAAVAGAYERSLPGAGAICPAANSGNILAQNDISYWLNSMKAYLGDEACGAIDCQSSGYCKVTIVWSDDLADTVGVGTSVTSTGAI